MNNKECEKIIPSLTAFIHSELSDSEREAVDRHLQACHACKQLAHELETTSVVIRGTKTSCPPPEVDLTGVWEEIESQVDFGPGFWHKVKNIFGRPAVWVPAVVASATAAMLFFILPMPKEQLPLQMSRVESVSSQSGQVMVFQTAESSQPIIWIMPGEKKEASS